MTDKATYELCEPFDIDHGELEGINPRECFVLGVEWQMIAEALDTGRRVSCPIHAHNVSRIRAMCERRGREHSLEPADDEWVHLTVEAM